MDAPVRWNTKRELSVFFMVTFALSWLFWLLALFMQSGGLSMPLSREFLLRAGTFGPTVSGLVLACCFGGKGELRSLIKSMVNIRMRPRWLLFAFCVLPAVSAVSCFILWLAGGALPEPQFEIWMIPVAFLYILILMGPLGEEAGWRGFALPRLMHGASPMKAAALLGLIWSVWHLPLFFIEGTTQSALAALFGFIPAFVCYLFYTVMISVLITLLFVRSRGSVFGAMIFHTMGNLSLGAMPLVFTKSGAVILLLVLAAATAGAAYRYRRIMLRAGECSAAEEPREK